MYQWLRLRFSPRTAEVLLTLWYFGLLLGLLLLAGYGAGQPGYEKF